jgi:succinate dehydrogenase / fumarate reductase membrane anchor subunit
MVRREVVGAHYGLGSWIAQRATAVVMLVYTVFFIMVVARMPEHDFWHWKALFEVPVMKFATLLAILSLLYHCWVGMRNIFMDYIKDTGLRVVLYVVVILALVFYGAWSVQILWGV